MTDVQVEHHRGNQFKLFMQNCSLKIEFQRGTQALTQPAAVILLQMSGISHAAMAISFRHQSLHFCDEIFINLNQIIILQLH